MRTKARFEREGEGNSQMAFSFKALSKKKKDQFLELHEKMARMSIQFWTEPLNKIT